MQKIIIRLLLAGLIALILFFLFSAYQYYRALHSDDPITPYVTVESGQVTVVRGDMAIDMTASDRYDLVEKDIIITKKNTLAIVRWPDHSETRLGAESRMQIDRMQVAVDYSQIEVEFALEQGKAWSTVVRTIYPWSYFRTRLPWPWIVAGVRGTIYDIDLVWGYIHSVDHSVALTDRLGRSVSLLPGELASVKNILQKLGKEALDTTWSALNTARDTAFLETRGLDLQKRIDTLAGTSGGLWDRFVRWILSFFPSFSDLWVIAHLVWDIPGMDQLYIPKEQIMRLYQNFQDTKFVQERDKLRAYIQAQAKNLDLSPDLFQTFTRGALWDAISFSGMSLPGSDALLQKAKSDLSSQIQNVLNVVKFQELESKAKETLRTIIQ